MTFKTVLPILFLSFLATTWADETVYTDDFASVAGFKSVNVDGSYDDTLDGRTREAHSYMSDDQILGGILSITVHEDKATKGKDGKAGVLALSYDRVPTNVAYSGFVYLGRPDEAINLPLGKDTKAVDLEHVSVSFAYRAANKTEKDLGLTVNCRFEIQIEDAFPSRIDFGELKATDEWQVFDKKLSAGTNQAAFLKKLQAGDDSSSAFKMAWGQQGPITSFQNGDTLLLDDLVIKMVK